MLNISPTNPIRNVQRRTRCLAMSQGTVSHAICGCGSLVQLAGAQASYDIVSAMLVSAILRGDRLFMYVGMAGAVFSRFRQGDPGTQSSVWLVLFGSLVSGAPALQDLDNVNGPSQDKICHGLDTHLCWHPGHVYQLSSGPALLTSWHPCLIMFDW